MLFWMPSSWILHDIGEKGREYREKESERGPTGLKSDKSKTTALKHHILNIIWKDQSSF